MTTLNRVLVTGATGFVGRALAQKLAGDGKSHVVAVGRRTGNVELGTTFAGEYHVVSQIDGDTDWKVPLRGCDTVVHLAARVHVLRETAMDPRGVFRRTNTDGTRRLAEQAARAGVRRFVFVSTIGVCGAESTLGQPIGPDSLVLPQDLYSESKAEAEEAVRTSCIGTGMNRSIVRPTMVYGRGAPGNFAELLRVLARRIPLPLASIRNRRSFVAIDNLVDLLAVAIFHPAAAGRILTVSDGEDLSTPDLLNRTACAMGLRGARLFPAPPTALAMMLQLAGRARMAQRLLGSLEVDIRSTHEVLGWRPPISVDEALRRAVA
jgi:nucleoside-diphosphate-sugar epimerase